MFSSDSVLVSKFTKLLNGFSFYFILFVPFTLNENPLTVYPKDSINFSGKKKDQFLAV